MKDLDYYIAIGYKKINSYFGFTNILAHHGIKGQKWGIRRFQNPDGSLTEEGKRRYQKNKGLDMNLQYFSNQLEIYDPRTDKYYNLMEDTYIRDKQVFAGKGKKKQLGYMTKEELVNTYGGEAKNWQHSKGFGTINYHGEPREAEIHWFQEESVGEFEHTVKKWLD